MLEMVSGTSPVLVSAMVWAALVVPSVWLENDKAAGARATKGGNGTTLTRLSAASAMKRSSLSVQAQSIAPHAGTGGRAPVSTETWLRSSPPATVVMIPVTASTRRTS